MLQISLLGTFQVQLDGEPVSIDARPAEVLLAYLVLNPERGHRRDKLAGVLWPDSSESNARNNLRQALWHLRKAVGDEPFEADKDFLRLAEDVSLICDAARLADVPAEEAGAEAWIEWASLHRGELLPGWYEDWVVRERERLEALFQRHMPSALRTLMQEQRWKDALQWAEHWISLGHVPEPAYRTLMTAHAALGDSAAVAASYQRCQQALETELGVEPSNETHQLYRKLVQEQNSTRVEDQITTSDRPDLLKRTEPPEAMQEIRFCTAQDGVQIAYAKMGDGPPLLKTANYLTHLEYDWHTPFWDFYVELAQDHQFLRYDERGSGLSDWEVDDLSFDAWVGDLESVVEAENLDRFSLMGISQGGTVAVSYAARHPDRVKSLILIGAYARGWANRDLTPQEQEEERAFITFIRSHWGTGSPAFKRMFSMQLYPDADPEDLQWLDDMQSLTTTPENAAVLEGEMHGTDVTEIAPRLDMPALIIHSRHDQAVPFEEGRRLATLIPNARFVSLNSNNHIPLRNEAAFDRMVGEVKRFLVEQG